MTKSGHFLAPLRAGALWLALLGAPLMALAPAPATAQAAGAPATAAQQQAASAFIDRMAAEAFAVLRDTSLSKEAARAKFKAILRANFALDEAGLLMIGQHRNRVSPEQLAAYRAALPDFLVNSYSDRLYDFSDASVKIVRTAPRGSRGDVDVWTEVTRPGQAKPIETIWQVKMSGPRPQVMNLTVGGVNVRLTQAADFNSYIQRNTKPGQDGFDALVDFMRKAK